MGETPDRKGFQMTSFSTNMREMMRPNLHQIGDHFFNVLCRIAELSPKYRAIQHYNAMSDATLAEMGMTREDVVRRIFGARMWI